MINCIKAMRGLSGRFRFEINKIMAEDEFASFRKEQTGNNPSCYKHLVSAR